VDIVYAPSETVETVSALLAFRDTPLKRGVTEISFTPDPAGGVAGGRLKRGVTDISFTLGFSQVDAPTTEIGNCFNSFISISLHV
jgi:hypothetical protein